MKNKEFIVCAAIYVNDGIVHEEQCGNIDIGFVIAGRRHGDCYSTAKILSNDNQELKEIMVASGRDQQGFITSTNRYVGRAEAWIIAKENNQIQFGLEACEPITLNFDGKLETLGDQAILISENLY